MSAIPSLNDQDVKKAGGTSLLVPKVWYGFSVIGLRAGISDRNGNFQLTITWAPLTDLDDASSTASPLFYDRLDLPVTNPEWKGEDGEDHTPPDTYNRLERFLVATYGEWHEELPEGELFALKRPQKKGQAYLFKGEAIDRTAYDEAAAEAKRHNMLLGIELYKAGVDGQCPIKNHVAYGMVSHNKGGNGRIYQNWQELEPERPANAQVIVDKSAFKYRD